MVKCPSNLDHVRSKSLPWGHHVRPIPYSGGRPHDQNSSRRIKLHRQLQRKGHIKIELRVRLSALRLFDVVHVYKIAEVSCRLIFPQLVFMSEAKNGRFTAAGSRCRQNSLNVKIARRRLADYVIKKCAACAAPLFFLIQSIKSLIYDVVDAVAVVIS